MNRRQRRWRNRIVVALAIFAVVFALTELGVLDALLGQPYALYVEFALFLVPYLVGGYDVLAKAARGIAHGQVRVEHFMMGVATVGE